MAKEHEMSVQPWGTLEELLLACAVNRHGTKSWESIAMEVANRSTTTTTTTTTTTGASSTSFLTPDNCKHKFDDLKRRFMSQNDDDSASLVPMVDELKKIRVEELRREVRLRDVSIVSLELKVKRLEEERELSLKEKEAEADLGKNLKEDDDGRDRLTSPENHAAGKSNSGDVSDSYDRENRSYNESNSTSQKRDSQRNDVVLNGKTEPKPEPERNELDNRLTKSEPGKVEDGEENDKDNVKQSSDVQSSMSLSRKKRRRRGGAAAGSRGGSSSGEEPECDEVSPAPKRAAALKSEPLVEFLGTIRSHRLGSVFQRRLRSQESQRYKNLIRQHLELQTIEARLDKGVYLNCFQKFFRDLLLLFNNAIVFFRKSSPEHVAAQELRALVLKEMKAKLGKTRPFTAKTEPKQEIDLAPQPKKSSMMVTCGKRSSSKAAASEGVNSRKGDKKDNRVVEDKQKASEKKINGSFFTNDDKGIRKKRSQERVRRDLTLAGKGGKGGESEHEFGGNELSSHDALEVKADKEENVKKKQGVASFLKRMKQNSPKEAAEEERDTDVSVDDSEDSKVEKEEKKKKKKKKKKGSKIRSDEKKERITRNSTRARETREDSRKAKRGVGRPPKRTEKVSAASGKRGRDNSEPDVGKLKKRSRR